MPVLDDLLSLRDRVAIVAGGAGGIGSAIATTLHEAGARVVCLDRPGREGPPGSRTLACDLTRSEQVEAAVATVHRDEARLDIIVHAAGVVRDAPVWKLDDAEWSEVMAVNVDSAFYWCEPACRTCARREAAPSCWCRRSTASAAKSDRRTTPPARRH
jgi:NAD(P)-dependent dehydrogenase (short-subunit alcohol dehydrogenase family)